MTDTRIQAIKLILKGFFKIKNKSGKSVKFYPNQAQILVLNKIKSDWEQNKKSRLIIIKGRQQGMSTLIQILQLALCITTKGWQAYTMTHRLDLAKDIFEQKIKYAFDYLPESFKVLLGASKNNVRQLMFANIDKSTISVGTSGRGGTYQSIHISEGGKMSESPETWSEMINGTLEAGTEADLIIHESTADGGLGLFYEYVQNNIDDVLFLSWTLQDEYQATVPNENDWKREYKQLAKDFKLCEYPKDDFNLSDSQFYWYYLKAKQLKEQVKVQYPLSLDEAFISTSHNYFNLSIIEKAENRIKELIKNNQLEIEEKNGFTIFRRVNGNNTYVVSVDCSTGESNDDTSINVFNAYTLEQVACATGKFNEEMTARMAVLIASYYNEAFIGVEINNMGRAVQNFIERLEYPNEKIYKRYEVDSTNPRLQKIAKVGWLTSSSTRPILLTEFKTSFENYELIINDLETLKQMRTFVNKNGKFEAEIGKKDDRVLSCMIGYQVAKYVHQYS